MRAEHGNAGGVDAIDGAVNVEGKNGGGNVFEDRFRQFATVFDFLDGLLKAGGEVVDLFARASELAGHLIEGLDEDTQFIVGSRGDTVIEIAARNLLGGFGEGLNRDGDAFGEEECDPSGGEKEKHGNEREAKKNLAFEQAKFLIFGGVGEVLTLDRVQAVQKVVGNVAADEHGAGFIRSVAGDVEFAPDLPHFGAAGKSHDAMECGGSGIFRHAGGFGALAIGEPDDVEF